MSAATFTGITAADAAPAAAPTVEPTADSIAPKDATAATADTLESRDVELLAKAEAEGARAVTLIIATDKGEAADVAAAVQKLGGTVTRRFDKVGYVLASVPTAKVLKAAALDGIAAVDLDEKVKVPDPQPETRPGAAVTRQAAPAGPGPNTPAANPYMPANEIGAVDFRKANPTWDGRGVTIGIMDSGVDLDNPALQTTSTGERKIVDWVTATDPVLEGDASWRAMVTQVNGPAFTYAGSSYRAPAGTWRVSAFAESITAASEPKGDVNLDGDTTDRFGVLYDPVSHDIRVDSNQNLDFTDDAVMRPYREKFDVGHFGTDKPETAIRDQMPFVVEYREDVDATPVGGPAAVDYVSIGLVEDMHGSHVSGIAAANDMLGNANFDGVAPGAKLVSSRACSWGGGCTAAALTTGMVDLVVNRKVDVINMSIGGLPALNDGNNARARLYDTLINDYGVQMFISAGNSGPGLNTIGDPSVATNVVSVAASISKESWLANYGSVTRTAQQLFNFSSRGPREDGGFKPNIAAPGSAVATAPMWQAGAPVPEAGYSLPPGYAMINGTSMASPSAAGGAALLLSAAKATDRGITPAALRRAIYTSAKPIPNTPVAGQGYGQIDVVGAWKLMETKIETRKYTSSAPVCTAFSDQFTPKNQGVGIYNTCASNAGGLKANTAKAHTIKVTRTTGPTKNVTHKLTWVGNDGTFTSAGNVTLPLNKTTNISVTVKPKVGAHSAILRIDDPATHVIDFEVLNTVVVANEHTKPGYAFSTEDSVDRNLTKSYFVNVPAGAAALQVNLSGIATGSQTRFVAFSPAGVPVDSTSSLECYTNFSNQATCKGPERSYANPAPGIWEIEVESRRTSPALENPYELTTRIQGTQVSPAVVQLPSVVRGQATPVSWTVKNQFGPVVVTGQGGPLQSAVQSRPTIADGEQLTYQIVVPAGATALDVSIGRPSDAAADLDLTVRLGETVVGQSADGDSEEAVSVPNPAAGTYTVVIDGYAVPAGTTAFDYRDVYSSPALGSVRVAATPVSLANGASTTITGQVTALDVPPAGRTLYGQMNVVTDQGAVIGSGSLQIAEVR
ncbi:MAG TPA: S8 family serine peptidase [Actinoplanes sp.]